LIVSKWRVMTPPPKVARGEARIAPAGAPGSNAAQGITRKAAREKMLAALKVEHKKRRRQVRSPPTAQTLERSPSQGASMPGNIVSARCRCGFERDLRPGATWSQEKGSVLWVMAYEDGDLRTADADYAAAKKLEVIKDPFTGDLSPADVTRLRLPVWLRRFFGPSYRCPSCGRKRLKLTEVGLWD
jgi:hypothetical protein